MTKDTSSAMLTARDEQILQAHFTYRYLTVCQVSRCFFSPRSTNYTGERLKLLVERGFLSRFPLPTLNRGNREYVYTLTQVGMKHLASLGMDLTNHYPPSQPPPSYQHIRHSLAVNDVLLCASLLPQQNTAIELRRMRTEWMLKKQPFHVTLPAQQGSAQEAQKIRVIPDGLLDFRFAVAGTNMQAVVLLEVDLGTEEQKQFRRKVIGLHTVATDMHYKAHLGAKEAVTIAFVTLAGEKRQADILKWIGQELTKRQKMQDADLFVVTRIAEKELIPPARLFLEPLWATCGIQGNVSLLELS